MSPATASTAPAAASTPANVASNPLLTESTLPYHLPPFDRIKDADYEPAFEQGMAEHLKEIEAIANNPAPPTFENTVVAMERAGQLLDARGPHLLQSRRREHQPDPAKGRKRRWPPSWPRTPTPSA